MAQVSWLPALHRFSVQPRCILARALVIRALSLGAALFLARTSMAEPSAEAIVEKYVRAARGVNLRGRVLTVHPTPAEVQTTVRRVVRRSDGRSLSVFESPRSEKGVIVAEDARWSIRYSPLERIVRRKLSFAHCGLADPAKLARLILRNYRVEKEGEETIAGRACYRLCFTPKSGQNGVVRIWVDRTTGAELRRDDLDAMGSTVSLVLFTSVAFPSRITDAELTPRFPQGVRVVTMSQSRLHTNLSELTRAAGFTVRAPLSMPAGFHYVGGVAGSVAGRRSAFLRYTDGLLDLTLIETPRLHRGARPSRSVYVMPRPYGEVQVEYGLDDMQVVLVGRGEPRDLVAAAESLDPERENRWRREVATAFNGHSRQIASLRSRGLSGDTVVALLTLALHSGRSEQVLLSSYLDAWSWRELARQMGIPEALVARRIQTLCNCP